MNLSDFDFDLPENLIALRPARPRTSSRLLVSNAGKIVHDQFANLMTYLGAGDLLVLNNTKVIAAQLSGKRRRMSEQGETFAAINVNLLSMDAVGNWLAMAKPAKRVKVGEEIVFADDLRAEVLDKAPEGLTLKFNQQGDAFDAALAAHGNMPLPPYIASRRPADVSDLTDYQTVFAKQDGAVAAPTASLHFDVDQLDQLRAMGVATTEVTLHVGAGTFLPVKVDNVDDHKMHSEWGEVTQTAADKIAQTQARGGRVIPVGTTALRLIETAAQSGQITAWTGDTDIFIKPGFSFNVTNGLITNFHLPKSTLLMLVSALIGKEQVDKIYAEAIDENYRFFSYGDASFLLP